MLTRIEIRNFAIIDRLEIELDGGLCVLTGETGAGKSIVIDALGLVLGDRASSDSVRPGSERAEVTAHFHLATLDRIRSWLAEQGLDEDDECLVRRIVTTEGRSRAFINGRATTTATLRELGDRLIDIHGQHEHQSLTRRGVQRVLLDDYADHAPLLRGVGDAWARLQEIDAEIASLRGGADREDRADLLRYQVRELQALELEPGELERVEGEHRRQANAERLLEQGYRALALAYEGDGADAHTLAGQATAELESLLELDGGFAAAHELLASAVIQLQEGADALRRHLDSLEVDPERLRWLDRRLESIHDLARKHRIAPEELPGQLERLQRELADLEQSESRVEALQEERERTREEYDSAAAELRESRRAAGRRLGMEVSAVMQQLGMPEGRLEIAVEPAERGSASGTDRVEFLVTVNPGQPARPVARVASGGELSRISLAIQVVAAHNTGLPTMIFDEVDSGIGGGVAEVVGAQLSRLARRRQILAVTHLPQVASFGDRHLRVQKLTDRGNTITAVQWLEDSDRVEELARMLGGMEITSRSRDHAREMISTARRRAQEVE
ncbi:MAG TPA: DNA repair protein RecN [Gammaproteobacteria bacterium]|nr:DNA repair protein RecN [Gammaproteobacteria bacterium]